MANRSMTKSEANEYCLQNGYKLFIDFCMREKVVIIEDFKTIVHFEQYDHDNGVIRLQTTEDGLELWIGGRLRYCWDKDNQK